MDRAPTTNPVDEDAEKCPSCGYLSSGTLTICPRCGIVVEKYLHRQARIASAALKGAGEGAPARGGMKTLLWALLLLAAGAIPIVFFGGKEELKRVTSGSLSPAENASKLFHAVQQNDVATVRRLLSAKTDPNFVENGKTPLEAALGKEYTEIATLLVQGGASLSFNRAADDPSLIQECIAKDLPASVSCLLNLNAPLQELTPKGHAPLVQAVQNGDLVMVRMLMEHGKSANIRDRYGNTPLMEAARTGRADMVKLLIGNGADVNARDKSGYTPLMLGIKKTEIVKMLIDAGAEINVKTAINYTPLHCAVAALNLDAVKLLIEKGADVSAKDAQGVTPLKISTAQRDATSGPFPEMTALLKKAGAIE
ncbi:ankyrin repeat domain-containing protein [Geomonas sp. RF6]|uniref:ankyrin repeat domain-containing protein n=1 Tax=Geomonas sp. RF6 TaxID=2897342 RepID=UPI001E3C201C|nr:ankyrin repeat domain-containing protein [Geomonas sp. RF6]UFS71463.1 ankyrin repeat domain-containing protein [Geomonas sp. RF6]